MNEIKEPIFVIGAARSGTHLLASVINENFNDIIYVGEVNEIWKKYVPSSNYDIIPSSYATDKVKREIQQEFLRFKKNHSGGKLLEKTPANTLRMSFISNVFPNAKFIHIIRDGRDVAISARKKYHGDIRKITKTKSEKVKFNDKLKHIVKLSKKKLKNGIDLSVLLRHFPRYIKIILSTFGIKNKTIWGPRFPGIKEYYNKLSLIELGAIQWKVCVDSVINFAESNNDLEYLEIKYEDLIKKPDKILTKTFDFIGITDFDKVKHNIIAGEKKWKEDLSNKEKKRVSQHIEYLLKNLGYEKTTYHTRRN